ncbi:radical SAM family heme chaperone HemW [Microlunatus antarcticus]|uniref:Heme chaperone HemW n=1 Tax=Microlunatus antarcticus TaxID=53388 RepID=A0A7W5JUJ9_9ACTN|nr:oxygen-independent coproporphyrinogen-3 oxidase [Microlunatus antarcticus]
MPSALPEGDPAPEDGRLPDEVVAEVGRRPFGIYLHVPFCTTRCGYCDFNTYTATELGPDPGASRLGYVDRAITELDLAVASLGPDTPPVQTVFVGGGTPTLLPPADLARFLAAVDARFGLAADAEVTTESNPDSIDAAGLATLREAGFTRVSFGMQSAVPHVLATLDRVHTPGRAQQAVADAWAAGFDHVSLDLIYGTPGESSTDWATSVEAALAAGPDHVSAYALIVEEGTRLAARVRRGELPMPDDDGLADAYVAADDAFSAARLAAYEVSNWARDDAARCRHNLGYWRGDDWWGIGPGAHSHVAGLRWWNVKHPAPYAARLAAGRSPAAGRERLDAEQRRVERVLLEVRLAEGMSVDVLTATERRRLPDLARRALITDASGDRIVLTRAGRLLADGVVRDLLD